MYGRKADPLRRYTRNAPLTGAYATLYIADDSLLRFPGWLVENCRSPKRFHLLVV
jgi:hypothetical protein